ncbi:hypothetical protein FQR65_LT10869 [Abscondita terminalis]|nr:hypothetical protein FQR65_LT10869 [Abscondita terminalis]
MFCSKVEADEAIKLNNQDNIKRFYLFSYHVYHLRDLLKCSICMELYNYPVELSNCKHVFCKECIKSYLEYADKEQPSGCPICHIPLTNVNSEQHHFLDKVTIFVKYALEDVNAILGSDLNKLPSYSKIYELWQRNKKSSTIFSNLKSKTILSSSVPDYSAILKAKQVVVRSNAKYVTSGKEGNDPFDAMVDNQIFKQNRRTYVNRKLENSKSCADKFQKFNDDINKNDVLNWLEDTRNKFDLLPITQQQIREEIPEFDLPSISQYGRQKVARSKPQDTKAETVTEEKHRTEDEQHSCSLEDSKHLENSKRKLKRHCVATCQLEDEIVIEQVNSEEDSKKAAIVNLMEDECLDAIDKDVLLENKILSETVELHKRSSLRSSTDSSRGWNRMREIKKTIGHGRKKGKLKVISSSSSTNLSNENGKKDKPINKIDTKAKELPTRILEIDEDSNGKKTFDLNVLETYFSKNLSKAIAAGITEEPHCSKSKTDDNVREALVTEEVSIQHNGTKLNDNEKEVVSEDVIPNSINAEMIQPCSLNNVYENMLTIHGMKDSTVEERMISNKVNFEDDDDIFTLATQETSKTDKFTKQLSFVRSMLNKREAAEVILNKLKDFLICDNKDVKMIGVQTEDTCALVSSVATQTNASRGKEVALQTDSCEQFSGFRISSTDMFQIQPIIDSTAQTDPLICRNCKVDVSKADKDLQVFHKVTENFALTGSFDNFTFETQDVIKGQKISVDNEKTERVSTKAVSQALAEVRNSVVDTGLLKHDIQTSVQTQSLKRIRTESETENDKSHTTKKDRYVNDFSVIFLSEFDGEQSEKEVPKLTTNDENIRIEPIPKRLKTQDIIKECEQIIKDACSSTLRIEQTQCPPEIHKPLTLLDKINRNSELIEDPMQENKTHKKFSESLFTSAEHLKDSECELINTNHQTNKQSFSDIINQFKEIEDSFEDDYNAEVESITEQILQNDRASQRIQILQNVTLGKNIEDELEAGVNCNKSADMFDSDIEIVETTPQKNRPKGLDIASQTSNPKAKMKLLLEDEFTENDALDILSCFNKTFTPPPEFQDFIDNTSNPICAEKENVPFSSLSSDLLENEFINKGSKFDRDSFITSTPFPSTSQVLSSRSINLSPIHKSSKQMNPILAVQSAGKLPLTITGNETPKRQRMSLSNITSPKQKTILNYVKPGRDLNSSSKLSQTVFEKPLSLLTKPNVACTRLDKKAMSLLVALANKKIITFSTAFSSTVTHMIVTVDKFNCLVDHTMKYVSAVAAGIWVLNIHWIEECLKQHKVVPEEDYEALDVSGIDGPRRSRLNRSNNPLLKNYVIYAAPPFKSVTQKEVEDVILLLGGEIVKRPDELTNNNNGKICLIITESSQSQSDQIYENWFETLKVLTVELEWLSRSVGKFEPLSLKPFAMWYEESMTDLAYPSALLEDVPYSTFNTLT